MTSLIVILSSDTKNWKFIASTIKVENWDKIIGVCDEFAYNNFSFTIDNLKKIKIHQNNLENSFDELSKFLKKEILDFEVALDLSAGSGRENMLVVSSCLRAGLSLRFVYTQNEELKEFNILKDVKI